MAGGPIRLPIVSKFDDRGVRNAEKALIGFGKSAAVALGAATAAVAAFGAKSVKAFADFDAEMTKSVAIMGDVSDALRDDMADAAREVAKQTTFSANEAAESFFFLASAGLDAAQSIEALPAVANFAQAGMFDMAQATDLLTDAQSALGLTSDDAATNLQNMIGLSDVLVKANTLANASVSQFSEALTNKAAASMRSLNIDMEEGVAVLAVFADQGIKGSQAGTTFNATIRGLTNGVQRNAKEFDRLGIEVFNASGEMNSMADIVGQMESSLGDLSVEQQRAELTALGFTEETLAGTLALIGNSEAIREYEGALRDAGGTTDDVAANQLQTFNAQLELMKSRFGDVMLSVGEGLMPTMMEFAESLGPILDELGPSLIKLFEDLGPVILALVEELPNFIDALIPLIPVVGDMALLTLQIAQVALPALGEIIDIVQPLLEGFTGVMADHGEVIGAVIVAIGLMVMSVRIASGAMAIFAGSTATATGSASGLFGVLTKHPFVAVTAAIIGGAVAMFTFRDSIRESGRAGELFLEAWSYVMFGLQWFTKTMVNGALEALELLHLGTRKVVEAVTNDIRKLGGLPPITLPELKLPRLDVKSLEDYREVMGLTKGKFGDMEFPTVDVSGISDVGRRGIPSGAPGGPLIGTPVEGFFPSNLMMPQQPSLGDGFFMNERGNLEFRSTGMGEVNNNYNINVNAGLGVDGVSLGADIVDIISQYEQRSGPVFQRYG